MKKTLSGLVLIAILLNSCASSYSRINPEAVRYENNQTAGNIDFSYRYAVIADAGNKRYASYEREYNIQVVAVKIKNNSESTLKIGENVKFYTNEKEVQIIEPATASNQLQQSFIGYFLYLLLTPLKLFVASGENVETYPIGYILGPGITALNVIKATSANSSIKDDLSKYNVIGKELKSGEILTGILILRQDGYNALSVKLKP